MHALRQLQSAQEGAELLAGQVQLKDRKLAALQQGQSKLRWERAEAQREAAQHRGNLDSTRRQYMQQKYELQAAQQALAAAEQRAAAAGEGRAAVQPALDVARLEAELAAVRQALAAAEQRATAAAAELAAEQQARADAERRAAEAEERLTAVQPALDEAEGKAEALQREKDAAQGEAEALQRENEVAQYKAEALWQEYIALARGVAQQVFPQQAQVQQQGRRACMPPLELRAEGLMFACPALHGSVYHAVCTMYSPKACPLRCPQIMQIDASGKEQAAPAAAAATAPEAAAALAASAPQACVPAVAARAGQPPPTDSRQQLGLPPAQQLQPQAQQEAGSSSRSSKRKRAKQARQGARTDTGEAAAAEGNRADEQAGQLPAPGLARGAKAAEQAGQLPAPGAEEPQGLPQGLWWEGPPSDKGYVAAFCPAVLCRAVRPPFFCVLYSLALHGRCTPQCACAQRF